jgi:hypothetical protein
MDLLKKASARAQHTIGEAAVGQATKTELDAGYLIDSSINQLISRDHGMPLPCGGDPSPHKESPRLSQALRPAGHFEETEHIVF